MRSEGIRKDAPYLALISAGLGMMGGSGNGIQNIGRGAEQGLRTYESENGRADVIDEKAAVMDNSKASIALRSQQLQQALETARAKAARGDRQDDERSSHDQALEDTARGHLGIAAGSLAETTSFHDATLAQGRWTYAGIDPDSKLPIMVDGKTGETKLGTAQIAMKPAQQAVVDARVRAGDQRDTTISATQDWRNRVGDQTDTKIANTEDYRGARLDQIDQTIGNTQTYREAQQGLRTSGMNAQDTRAHLAQAVSGAKSIVAAAAANGKIVSYDDAVQQSLKSNNSVPAPAQRPTSNGLAGASAPAAAPAQQRSIPAPPKAGDVMGGYTFMGGDPSQQSNWKSAQ
jgi:hypothetical protein